MQRINADRAADGRRAVREYAEHAHATCPGAYCVDGWDDFPADDVNRRECENEAITDLLVDVLHHAVREGHDLSELLKWMEIHVREELKEEAEELGYLSGVPMPEFITLDYIPPGPLGDCYKNE